MLMVPSTHGFVGAVVVGWDPANMTSGVILSNSNKTATANFNSGQTGARGFGRNSGQRYFEMTFGGNTAVNGYLGICNGSFAVGTTVGGDTNSISISPGGGAYGEYYSGTLLQYIGVAPTGSGVGDIVMVAANLTGGQVFLGVNGVWANTSGPGTTGDWTVSGATMLYPVIALNAVSTAFGGATLNTGDTPFAYALPSGYTAWG